MGVTRQAPGAHGSASGPNSPLLSIQSDRGEQLMHRQPVLNRQLHHPTAPSATHGGHLAGGRHHSQPTSSFIRSDGSFVRPPVRHTGRKRTAGGLRELRRATAGQLSLVGEE